MNTATNASQIKSGKGNQGLGKHEQAAKMCRLVRELEQLLEDQGLITSTDHDQIANVYYEFLATLPQKVQEDLRHG